MTLVKTAKIPPGSKGLPLLGETLSFLSDQPKYVADRVQRHGRVFYTHLFGKDTIALIGAEGNKFILTEGMKALRWKDGWPPTFAPLLGDVLLMQDGELHRKKRNLLMPAMHLQAVEGYVKVMEERLAENLPKWEKEGSFSWYEKFNRLTFEVSSILFLGMDSRDTAGGDKLNKQIVNWMAGLMALPIDLPWTRFGKAKRLRKELLAYVGRAIQERKANPEKDALGLLVGFTDDQGDKLTDEELQSQALFLVSAGFETTSSLLTYMTYALAQNPEVMARAREEQKQLGIEGPLTLESLKKMTYLDQVVTEVERMYAPISFGMRGAEHDCSFGGYDIPAGWRVLFSIDATHHDPEYFPNPEKFDPDRFAEGNKDRNTFKLVGFGGGPRFCPGMMMARTQAKVYASHLLRGYDWTIDPNQSFKVSFLPARKPKDGMKTHFRRL